MKAISSTFLALAFSVCASFLSLTTVQAQTAAPQAQQAPAKKSFFSRFRRNPAPVAPQAQAAPQQQVQQAAPQRKRFRLPTFKKPDFSKIPKPKLPKFSKPKVSMPKVNMPKFKWPFKRQAGQVVQDYPNGIRNPKLGGAYGIIRDDQVKFYEVGPSQPGGADATLSRGSLVTIRSNDHAWAYVTLKDGQSGYIGLDQVRMASAKEAPKPPAPKPKKRQTKKRSNNYIAKKDTKEDYTPPALPTAAVELPESPEVNPLLRKVTPEETVSNSVEPMGFDEDLVDTTPEEPQPVDSPEVLFDPILDPLSPSGGPGPQPFLSDPIPSIEEELRAIQAAKATFLLQLQSLTALSCLRV